MLGGKIKSSVIIGIAPLLLCISFLAHAGVQGSKHDLSVPGYSPCVYCHTPHSASTDPNLGGGKVLWNINNRNYNFTPYQSPTMSTTLPNPFTPSPYSLLCLSCHDGGTVPNGDHITWLTGPARTNQLECTKCHVGSGPATLPNHLNTDFVSNILVNGIGWDLANNRPDLSNDHPISVPYPSPAQKPDFQPVNNVKTTGGLLLFEATNKVECPTCHDPHNPVNVPFLRVSNAGSQLCLTCHIK